MKIPLKYNSSSGRLSIPCYLKYKSIPILMSFVVDTGSPITILCPIDVIKLRRAGHLPDSTETVCIGGDKINISKINNVNLKLRNEKGKFSNFRLENIGACVPSKSSRLNESILGLDFFSDKKLIVDLQNNDSFIEF